MEQVLGKDAWVSVEDVRGVHVRDNEYVWVGNLQLGRESRTVVYAARVRIDDSNTVHIVHQRMLTPPPLLPMASARVQRNWALLPSTLWSSPARPLLSYMIGAQHIVVTYTDENEDTSVEDAAPGSSFTTCDVVQHTLNPTWPELRCSTPWVRLRHDERQWMLCVCHSTTIGRHMRHRWMLAEAESPYAILAVSSMWTFRGRDGVGAHADRTDKMIEAAEQQYIMGLELVYRGDDESDAPALPEEVRFSASVNDAKPMLVHVSWRRVVRALTDANALWRTGANAARVALSAAYVDAGAAPNKP
jgi:hypothetical protein